jgi:hypothetical protein
MHEQSTKPHTLAVRLGDSPAVLAAWLVEKLHSWTHCGGNVESVFTRDELLTWITDYWVTGSVADRGPTNQPVASSPHGNGQRRTSEASAQRSLWPRTDGGHAERSCSQVPSAPFQVLPQCQVSPK